MSRLALLVLSVACLGCGESDAPPSASGPAPSAAAAPAPAGAAPERAVEALSKAYADARAAGDKSRLVDMTLALFPPDAELRRVLSPGPATDAFLAAYRAERLRGDANEAAGEILRPGNPAQTVVRVHSATTEELARYEEGSTAFAEFPGGLRRFAERVAAPGRVWHAIEYLEPGKEEGMKFSVLTVLDGKVLYLHRPWRALPEAAAPAEGGAPR
jgi:hypothetical protein